jgi:phage terminase large subunit-like protein
MARTELSLHDQIKEAAEQDLLKFIRLVSPGRMLGGIHEEVISWWGREDAKSHQLLLLPRGHQKSQLIAFRVAWEITRNPAVTILYASATANLAEKQLQAIKDILTSKEYRKYWPEMVNDEESKRARWTVGEIQVDHPIRKEEGIRDPTVFTAGLTSNIVGMHCDIFVLDDVVVRDNAYREEERQKVKEKYSQFASIENPEAKEWVVGTRYHPKDLYSNFYEMESEVFDALGNVVGYAPVFEIFERQVEDRGDGTGEFLWPRQRRADGKWFGFDNAVLAKKKAQYLDRTQFRAQYYNDPNDPESGGIPPSKFQYYDRDQVKREQGQWYYRDKPLALYAAIDFAFSTKKAADYTALVVIGVDPDSNYYVLDIKRFKSERISDYWEAIKEAYIKWEFRKLRAETTVAQQSIVREIKESYIKPSGLYISIDEHRPATTAAKEERIKATLDAKYDILSVWHYKGGNCQILEDELILEHAPHDDVKDALACAIDVSVPPIAKRKNTNGYRNQIQQQAHTRFGGYG